MKDRIRGYLDVKKTDDMTMDEYDPGAATVDSTIPFFLCEFMAPNDYVGCKDRFDREAQNAK